MTTISVKPVYLDLLTRHVLYQDSILEIVLLIYFKF